MSVALMLAAMLGTTANPLLGTWVGAPATRIDAAARSTMTITRAAILFGSGQREVGVAPIAGFEGGGDGMLSIRTRFGAVYRFRFDGADRMCRVEARAAAATQCFTRDRAAV